VNHPLLFNRARQLKPAFYAVMEALKELRQVRFSTNNG
jgi:hypothetical protein